MHGRVSQAGHTRTWAREIAELAALFVAVGLAHVLTTLLGHRDPGPVVLIGVGSALIAGSALHRKLSASGGVRARLRRGRGRAEVMILWRVRARVAERPGALAALSGAFAALRCSILSLQIAPAGSDTLAQGACEALDEFVIEAPARLTWHDLRNAVERAGGADAVIVPAQVKDLIDPGIQALLLADRVRDDPGELLPAMRELLRTSDVRWNDPAGTGPHGEAGDEEDTALRLPVDGVGTLLARRPELPFSPTEAARATALAAAGRRRRAAGDLPRQGT
ncbi:hypothetical protein JOL79_23970 [Microbispora sp. RL4-1S]|uniref:ACT domain-containing protein n=1 Tax=Microbispora oryzae TaxID=2806554 RepID=A0A940WTS8_9ACTN|nr:hypothetical protein [Microbispora oryzae]MBP2706869.1 hypothetical protein [Microbispora oryzae]